MRCSACDTPIAQGATFCAACGAQAGGAAAIRRRGSLFDGSWWPFSRGLSPFGVGLMLIGLAVLYFTGTFWPWILGLLGLTAAAEELGRRAIREAVVAFVFLTGLSVLFAANLIWPGILLLLGIVALIDRFLP